jgi:hypothetical protein
MPASVGQRGPREVVLGGTPALALDEAKKKYPRVEDVYNGWAWRLAREPEVGVPVPLKELTGKAPTADVRVVRSGNLPGLPCLVLLYRFDDAQVVILQLRVFPPGRDPTF